jgi:ankyrin repeat protein
MRRSLMTVWAFVFLGCPTTNGGDIHDAARLGEDEKVKELLKNNAELVNARDQEGRTPLHIAARFGHLGVVQTLIAGGADVNARIPRDPNDGDRVQWSISYDIIDGTEVMCVAGDSPLHWCAHAGHADVAELLILKGSDVNAKNACGWTPLHMAARFGHLDAVQTLIAKEADVNARIPQNANDGNEATGRYFSLQRGTILCVPGDSPLHWCAQGGDTKVAELLILKGSDVNGRNGQGATPLHIASRYRHKELVDLLVQENADVGAKMINGKTALDIASAFRFEEIVEVLTAAHVDVRALVKEMWSLLPAPEFEIKARLRVRGSPKGKEVFFETPGAGFSYGIDVFPQGNDRKLIPVLRGNELVCVGTGEWFAQDANVGGEIIAVKSRKSFTGNDWAPASLDYEGATAWSFQSDETYPLTFQLVSAGGVYLCGRGTISTPSGQVFHFGENHNVDMWLPLVKATWQLNREAAVQALGWLANTPQDRDKAVPALIAALKDDAMEVRRDAAEALGRIGDARAVESLTLMREDASEWVRAVAEESLGHIRQKMPSDRTGPNP